MRLGINTFLSLPPFTNESTNSFQLSKTWGFDTVELPVEDPFAHRSGARQSELEKNMVLLAVRSVLHGADRTSRATPEQQQTVLIT